ncbi:MAG: hypothetical protein KKF89_01575, partial [Nanoarchaeota archaeon]|nr:hypothetical protein [Nanoarchaeota archaeon]
KVLKREDFIVDFEKTTYLERNFDIDMKEDSYQLCVDLYILNKTIVECEPLTITKKSLKESPASIKYEVEKGNLKNILIFFLVTMLIASTITTIVMVEIKKKYYLLGIPKRIKTRTELAKYLESVSYKIFSKYLGINRNDIADFVKYVFENESLEKELRRLEKKTDIIFALKNFEGETESEESGQKLDFNNQKKEQKSTEKIFQEEIAENIQDDKVSTLETETFKPEDKLEQEVLTEEKSLIDFSKQALTKDEYFYLFNGVVLKSISDLQSYLHVMPEDVFSHHVIFERNDFANWIEGVFKIPTLAEKVRLCKNKNELIEQMSKYG